MINTAAKSFPSVTHLFALEIEEMVSFQYVNYNSAQSVCQPSKHPYCFSVKTSCLCLNKQCCNGSEINLVIMHQQSSGI